MPKLRLVMLHVSAIDYGTHYVVVDRNGRRSSRLSHRDTGPSSADRRRRITRRIKWSRAIRRMMQTLQNRTRRKCVNEWEIKFQTWQKSLVLRERHRRPKQEGARFFTRHSRPDWEMAYECMLRQYYNKVVRKERHTNDPWSLWAETVSQNHNRKEHRNESGKES